MQEKYNEYNATLQGLSQKIAETEKDVIVAETTLRGLEQERARVVQKCEQLAGVPIDKVPEVLKEEQEKLDDIMTQLSNIDITQDITEETLVKINAIKDKYSIS